MLRLLAERPMHGYELITEFEERSGGRWRPSPGSVYPTLAQLEDEGLVRSVDDGGRKRFELTDAGRTWLDEHSDDDRRCRGSDGARGGRGDLRRLGGEIVGQLRQLGRFGTAGPTRAGAGDPRPAPARSCTRSWRLRRPTAVTSEGLLPDLRRRKPSDDRKPSDASGQSRRIRPATKSIERVTVAATKRSSFGARGTGPPPAAARRTACAPPRRLAACVVLTAWAWTMNAVVVSSRAWRCSASPAATRSVVPRSTASASADRRVPLVAPGPVGEEHAPQRQPHRVGMAEVGARASGRRWRR